MVANFTLYTNYLVSTNSNITFIVAEKTRIDYLKMNQCALLKVNKIAARWPAKAVAHFYYSF